MTSDNRPRTARGFLIFDEFLDLYGSTVRVQESSLATDVACWIFCERDGIAKTPHLDADMALRLRNALGEFIIHEAGLENSS
jgi:hypothetical protein